MTQPWQDPRQPNQPFGPPSWGQAPPNQPPSGPGPQQPPYGTPPYGTQPYGSQTHGTPPYGTPPYGTQPYVTQPSGYPPAPPGQQPLGQQPIPTNDIGRYAPPKSRGPIVAAIVGVVVLLAVVAAGLILKTPPAAPVETPAPSAPATQADRPGHPFIMPSNSAATGRWQVVGREWTDQGVVVQVRVWCDTDTCSYGFTSFANNGRDPVNPTTSPRQPQLGRGFLTAGNSVSGYVFLPLPRGAATLILTTSSGRQISALPIAA